MKVLFLDIDGVLNSHQHLRAQFRQGMVGAGRDMPFCPISCSNLVEVLARIPDLQIVVSSSWRIGRTLETLKDDLRPSSLPLERIVDMTPVRRSLSYEERGHEIQRYLDERAERGFEPITEFVILDDNDDMVHLRPKLVLTDCRMGFMWDKAVEVLERFGVSPEESERGFL